MVSPSTNASIKEVQNLQYVLEALNLISLPNENVRNKKYKQITLKALIDINSFIIKELDKPFGLRQHHAAIGFQKVLLPMPDELYFLINEYLEWLN